MINNRTKIQIKQIVFKDLTAVKLNMKIIKCKNVNLKNLPPGDYRNFVIGAQFYYITNDRSCYDSQTQGPCQ